MALILALILSLASAAEPVTVMFLGDSLTEGLGVKPEDAFPAIVGTELSKKGKPIKAVNAGVSGSTSASGPSRMKWALKAKPQWVVLALGANDGLRGLSTAEMKNNLEATIKIAQDAGVKVLFAGMRVPPNFGKDYGIKFEKVFKDIAAKNKNVVFVPFLLEKVGGEKDFNQADGIHPNEKGHKVMAELIVKALEPKL